MAATEAESLLKAQVAKCRTGFCLLMSSRQLFCPWPLTLTVGIVALNAGVDPEVGKWMAFAGLSALIGNALPRSIMTFTGNLGEAGMQFGLLEAARIVYGGM